MNRPLEFRVWTGTKMEYNIVAGRDGVFYAKIHPRDSACLEPTSRYEIDTPVMQFTGKLDVLGGKIFEGDIVKYPVWLDRNGKKKHPQPGVVIYDNGCFFVKVGINYFYFDRIPEIIGNIYENPEYLKNNE